MSQLYQKNFRIGIQSIERFWKIKCKKAAWQTGGPQNGFYRASKVEHCVPEVPLLMQTHPEAQLPDWLCTQAEALQRISRAALGESPAALLEGVPGNLGAKELQQVSWASWPDWGALICTEGRQHPPEQLLAQLLTLHLSVVMVINISFHHQYAA